jgi:hypothetical protein
MGRPVNKRYFGATDGSVGTEGNNFTVNVKVGSNAVSETGIILKQKGPRRFRVDDAADGSGNEGICTLVNKAVGSLAANEMMIQGFVAGANGNVVRIAKLYNRTCRDFNNNRYKWTIVDDSSENYLELTAI